MTWCMYQEMPIATENVCYYTIRSKRQKVMCKAIHTHSDTSTATEIEYHASTITDTELSMHPPNYLTREDNYNG